MEWQAIETAPKGEGNEIKLILLGTAGDPRSLLTGYWDAYYAPGGHGYEDGGNGWIANETGEYRLLHDGPTHWMPLPEPPK